MRGVNNLGGKRVAMAKLQEVVTSLGHADVMTYIQSGNVLLLHSGQAVRRSEESVLVSARQAG